MHVFWKSWLIFLRLILFGRRKVEKIDSWPTKIYGLIFILEIISTISYCCIQSQLVMNESWMILRDKFVNHMQKTDPNRSFFKDFGEFFWWNVTKFITTNDECMTPHACFLIDIQKSHFSLNFEDVPKSLTICLLFVKCPGISVHAIYQLKTNTWTLFVS